MLRGPIVCAPRLLHAPSVLEILAQQEEDNDSRSSDDGDVAWAAAAGQGAAAYEQRVITPH